MRLSGGFCCVVSVLLMIGVGQSLAVGRERAIVAQEAAVPQGCPSPALSRVVRHRVAAGETLETIAQKYNLIPATLMGMNPNLRSGQAPVGTEILVPPFNGIRVELQSGETLREVAKRYNVRADVLFEVNGCQPNPRVVFVPGVNWSPIATSEPRSPDAQSRTVISGYPLSIKPSKEAILLGYGWKLHPTIGQVAFHGGVDLAAPIGTKVLTAGDGTVAFAGPQGAYGNLVVINHTEGLQTRYAQLERLQVRTGQTVSRGQAIGTVGTTGRPSSKEPHLHFEVRSRSNLGWVAENPEPYLMRSLPVATQ
jgi:lysostaphin